LKLINHFQRFGIIIKYIDGKGRRNRWREERELSKERKEQQEISKKNMT